MASKLEAAGLVTEAGELAAIANARTPNALGKLLSGRRIGTVFVPARRRMSGRRRWIAQAARAAGTLVVDDGAARALKQKGKSLLPSGITAVSGEFDKGDTVSVVDAHGEELARGLTNYSADQIDRIKGLKTSQIARALGDKPYDEVIHRNNMTLR
jgi:glutamate 5-kinase